MKRSLGLAGACALLFVAGGTASANSLYKCGPAATVTGNKYVNAGVNFITSEPTYHSAITSGTSGCDGLAYNETQQVEFIANSREQLQEEAAAGSGEHLAALGAVVGCPTEAQPEFMLTTQQNYDALFASEHSELEFLHAVKAQVRQNSALASQCQLGS